MLPAGDGRRGASEAHAVAPREPGQRRDEHPAAEPGRGPCDRADSAAEECACDRYYRDMPPARPRIVISGIGVCRRFGVGRERSGITSAAA